MLIWQHLFTCRLPLAKDQIHAAHEIHHLESRIQFWVDPSLTSIRRWNLSTLLISKLIVAIFAWLIPLSWDQELTICYLEISDSFPYMLNKAAYLVNKLRKPSVQVQNVTERHSAASVCDPPWSLMLALSFIWHCLTPLLFQANKLSQGGLRSKTLKHWKLCFRETV